MEKVCEIQTEVEHDGRRRLVGHCVCHVNTEGLGLDAQAGGEAREEISLVGAHIGAHLVVVAQIDIEFVGRRVLQAEGEMAEEVGEEG